MSWQYFTSYARADAYKAGTPSANGQRLLAFLDMVRDAVSDLSGGQGSEFRDTADLETGDHGESKILGALSEARVLVSVLSPNSLVSKYCGREWGVFELRALDRNHREYLHAA